MSETKKTDNQLQVILKEQGVEAAQAKELVEAFGGPFEEAGVILATYKDIKVTDVSDTKGMKKARDARLALKAARTTVERNRKQLKENINKTGRAIDSVARFVKEAIAPAEEYLQLQEDYAKIAAEKAAEAKHAERVEKLSQFVDDVSVYSLRDMDDETFTKLLAQAKADREAAIEADKKAEAERIKAEEAQKAEQAKRDKDAQRTRTLTTLGFFEGDGGNMFKGSFDTGKKLDELLELEDKPFDKLVDDAIKEADKLAAAEAEKRKAEQAQQERIRTRINHITSLGAVFDNDEYRISHEGEGVVVTMAEIERDTDEVWAKAVAMVKAVADKIAAAQTKADEEAKAAKEKADRLEREQRERDEADAKAKADADEQARQELLAPDKTKLLSLADGLDMVRTQKLPAVKTKAAQDVVNVVDGDLKTLIDKVRAYANKLK